MFQVIVFDFDGVLAASNAVKREAYYRIFSESDPEGSLVHEVVEEWKGRGNRFDVIRAILQKLGETIPSNASTGELEDLVTHYAERYNDICETHQAECEEVPGAAECLALLSTRYRLYVNSATLETPLRRVVQKRGWSRFFRDVYGSPKTKIENLHVIFQREQVAAAETVFVGDGSADLKAALECGCTFVGVRNSFNDFDSTGLTMVDDLRPLSQLLSRLTESASEKV